MNWLHSSLEGLAYILGSYFKDNVASPPGVLAESKSQSSLLQCRPDSPWENLSVGVGPVCQTSISTGLSQWEQGPCQERSPILIHLKTTIISPLHTNTNNTFKVKITFTKQPKEKNSERNGTILHFCRFSYLLICLVCCDT